MLMSDISTLSSAPVFTDESELRVGDETAISDAVFRALIRAALKGAAATPLNRKVTNLLGLSTDVDTVVTKQIGVSVDEGLHGLLVSIKPNTDDIILVNQNSTVMDIYLTDTRRQLRAAATLHREGDQPSIVGNEQAAPGYVRELGIWAMIGEMARS